jgi:AcrR family transcriptional regulator
MVIISKNPQERWNELLNAAVELFSKKSYQQTVVSDIVKRVGVSQGTFYYYFMSKEEIADELIDRPLWSWKWFRRCIWLFKRWEQCISPAKDGGPYHSQITPMLADIIEQRKLEGTFRTKSNPLWCTNRIGTWRVIYILWLDHGGVMY